MYKWGGRGKRALDLHWWNAVDKPVKTGLDWRRLVVARVGGSGALGEGLLVLEHVEGEGFETRTAFDDPTIDYVGGRVWSSANEEEKRKKHRYAPCPFLRTWPFSPRFASRPERAIYSEKMVSPEGTREREGENVQFSISVNPARPRKHASLSSLRYRRHRASEYRL
jgi:hypothetical protein